MFDNGFQTLVWLLYLLKSVGWMYQISFINWCIKSVVWIFTATNGKNLNGKFLSSLALLHCIGIGVIPPWFKPCFWWMGLCEKELVLGHLRAFTQSQDKKISFISSRRGRRVSKFDRWSVSIYFDYTPTSIHRWTWNLPFFVIHVKKEELWLEDCVLCSCHNKTLKKLPCCHEGEYMTVWA